MDGLFKQKLLSLRNPAVPTTFGEALLGDTSWLRKIPERKTTMTIPAKEVFSEKVQVIESLERFAEEKSQELKTELLKIEGGEILLRKEPGWDDLTVFSSAQALKSHLKLDSRLLDVVLKGKHPGQIKAFFVTESFRGWEEVTADLKDGFIDELLAGFPLKTAELFERMIKAMKLEASEVLFYPVEGEGMDLSQEVMEIAAFYAPEVIITLGARATQKILKSNDRLSVVHGQFFHRKVGEHGNFQVVPLFHPSIIETNLNMKKTAWNDMQKIMKHLKKLP